LTIKGAFLILGSQKLTFTYTVNSYKIER